MLSQLFWTYIVGPVAAFFPAAWRKLLPAADRVQWERAAALSGLLEITSAIAGMGYWYMRSIPRMISAGMEHALPGRIGVAVSGRQIADVALFVFATHPLTWLLIYAFVEGGVRLVGAAFTEDVRGTFPLYLFERVLFFAAHREEARRIARETRQHFAAAIQNMRERALMARLPDVPDELLYTRNTPGEILEVFSCRKKEEWTPPKIVLVDEAYYRLEHASVEKGPRPFRYRLRRLETGVPGRNVIVYERSQAVTRRN